MRTWILETSTIGKDGLTKGHSKTRRGREKERQKGEKEKGFAEDWAARVEPYGCEGGMKRLQLEP